MFSTLCETKYIYKYRYHTVITYLVSQQHGMSVVENVHERKLLISILTEFM